MRLSHVSTFACVLAFGLAAGCSRPPSKPADTIYFGGDIVTMEGAEGSTVEAVVTDGPKIVYAGDLKLQNSTTPIPPKSTWRERR